MGDFLEEIQSDELTPDGPDLEEVEAVLRELADEDIQEPPTPPPTREDDSDDIPF